MNKSFILSIALLALSLCAAAQNQYVNYQSMMVPCNYSAVSLVHSNESVYYFQADNMYISVMDINPYTMVPTGATYCSLLNQEFRMRGAFEDSDHNCVIYGFIPTAVASGTTYNGLQNYLPKNQGAFILKATDRAGLFVTKKVILF